MIRPTTSLHCLPSYENELGGSVHAALNVCKYLANARQPVEAVAPFESRDSVRYLAENYPDVKCNRVARSFPKRFSNSRDLVIWLRANLQRFDVVEIHGVWVLATLQAARICQDFGKPYFLRPHGSLDPFDLQKHSLLKLCAGHFYIRWLLQNSAGVICTANLEAERLKTFGATTRRFVIPLPVPLADISGDGQTFRKKHGIPCDAIVVLFLSRVDYKKGLDFLIPALSLLKREFPRLWFVLAGTGTPEFSEKVHGWLSENNILSFTKEVGFVSGQDKCNTLAAADIFALPSQNENFGIVNIEAMHAGLPLLISDQVYICKEIEEAGAGVVCHPNVHSVTEKLRNLLGGDIDLKQMGKRGQDLVRRLYRPEAATAALLELYAQILAG